MIEFFGLLASILSLLILIFGIIIAFMIYDIYKLTKGGSRGWIYGAITFISIAILGLMQALFSIIDILAIRQFFFIIFIPIISIYGIMFPIYLIKDMNIERSKWYMIKNMFILVIVWAVICYFQYFYSTI